MNEQIARELDERLSAGERGNKNRLAKKLGVTRQHINYLVKGHGVLVTPQAIRLLDEMGLELKVVEKEKKND